MNNIGSHDNHMDLRPILFYTLLELYFIRNRLYLCFRPWKEVWRQRRMIDAKRQWHLAELMAAACHPRRRMQIVDTEELRDMDEACDVSERLFLHSAAY